MTHSADLYQTFFNVTSDPIFVVDAATKTIVDANAQALNDAGYRSEELNGLFIDRLFHAQHQAGASAFSWNTDEADKPNLRNLRLIRKNAETIAVNVSVIPVRWGTVNYLFITARKTSASVSFGSTAEASHAVSSRREEFPTIIGRSIQIRTVCRLIGASAKSDVTVLIQGESGTGKEIIANAMHAHSHRDRGPLVKVNCAALTETLLESELFGHVRGAFTGAIRDRHGRFKQADGGTIFLDEIGSMSLAGQAKLLRVMQEHEFEPVGSSVTIPVDVRMITATNLDLARAVTEGKFRQDLYYRLNVFQIPLPPLRERKEDIALLAQHFLNQYSQAIGKKIQVFAPETLSTLVEHDWPGNVRELENAIEHAVIVENGSAVSPASLPMNFKKSHERNDGGPLSIEPGLRDKLNALEKQILMDTLVRANGIKKHAAAMLGIDARNLPYLLRKHRLDEGASSNVNLH